MNNNQAIGYVIIALEELGYSDDEIKKVEYELYNQFDLLLPDEAEEVYRRF